MAKKPSFEEAKKMEEGRNIIGGGKIYNRLYPGGFEYGKHAKSAALKKKIAGKMGGDSRKKKKAEEKEDAYQHFLYINGLEDDEGTRKRQMG